MPFGFGFNNCCLPRCCFCCRPIWFNCCCGGFGRGFGPGFDGGLGEFGGGMLR